MERIKNMNEYINPRYLSAGVIIASRYEILSVIGAGGFGVTYMANDKVLNQLVAIKEYLPGEFSTRSKGQTQVTIYSGEKTEQFEQGKQKFYEESLRLAEFRDVPGIVQIYDTFMENGTVYIVMEYLEGETLEERLKRKNKLSEKESLDIIIPVLRALEQVHSHKILHRDIAPNNIFLCKEGTVKLLDFGAARSVTGTHSKSLTVLYKEGYTAEEQYRSRGDQGTWTDVYSCGATLYRMVTGKLPPGAMERRLKDSLVSPKRAGGKVSRKVNNAIMNALNVEIGRRTQNAKAFIEDLTGEHRTKKHFTRTVERKVGKIPTYVKILSLGVGTLIAVFLALIFTGVIHFNMASFSDFMIPEGKTRVPNIINKSVNEAETKLNEKQLSLLITDKQFSEQIDKDKILSQSENPGSIVDMNITVSVVVSGGSKNAANGYELKDGETFVPDLQYKSLDEAMTMISEASLNANVLYKIVDTVERGKVIEQDLEAGSVARKNDLISFYVNDEEPVEEIEEEIEEAVAQETPTPEKPAEEKVESGGAGLKTTEGRNLLTYVNQNRVAAGLPELVWDEGLAQRAQNAVLEDATVGGVSDMDLMLSGRYVFRRCNGAKTAQRAVADWMSGNAYIPSEASQLLNPNYTAMGGALYYTPDGDGMGLGQTNGDPGNYKYHWMIVFR